MRAPRRDHAQQIRAQRRQTARVDERRAHRARPAEEERTRAEAAAIIQRANDTKERGRYPRPLFFYRKMRLTPPPNRRTLAAAIATRRAAGMKLAGNS